MPEKPTYICRVGNQALGRYDDRNFYVAEVRVAGEGAKDAGQDRLHNMSYFQRLAPAVARMIRFAATAEPVDKLEDFIKNLKKAEADVIASLNQYFGTKQPANLRPENL